MDNYTREFKIHDILTGKLLKEYKIHYSLNFNNLEILGKFDNEIFFFDRFYYKFISYNIENETISTYTQEIIFNEEIIGSFLATGGLSPFFDYYHDGFTFYPILVTKKGIFVKKFYFQ